MIHTCVLPMILKREGKTKSRWMIFTGQTHIKENLIMAFFDEMKKKVSQVGQSAAKSAKDFSETTRLNSEISDAENRINQLYTRIGYEIYCAHNADPLPEVATLIEQINTLHDRIDNCRLQIETINAANRCPNCGAKVKPGMAFCSGCGAPLAQPEPQSVEQTLCPACGAPIAPGAAFCTSCGSRLTPAPEPVQEPQFPAAPLADAAPAQEPAAPAVQEISVAEQAAPDALAESFPESQS